MMASFKQVPVVEVHKGNFKELWPSLTLAIQNATFVAIDAELTGLGSKKLLFAKSIDDRFQEMSNVARTRSIISLGISCFKLTPAKVDENVTCSDAKSLAIPKDMDFQVQTFNIWVLCNENFTVDPLSVKFLIEHGFDFNKQYATGLPYYRGNDRGEEAHPSLRQLFTELIKTGVPVVFHNAMVDLIFLYHSFYANVPTSLQTFTTDLSEVFHGGVFDTKYIAEYKARMPASYLEYVFRKCQRDNQNNMERGSRYTSVKFLNYPAGMKDLVVLPCSLEIPQIPDVAERSDVCPSYANHGWCSSGNGCSKSHDIDDILDNEDHTASKKKRKRQKRNKNCMAHDLLKEDGPSGLTATPKELDQSTADIEVSVDPADSLEQNQMDSENGISGKKLKASELSNIDSSEDSSSPMSQSATKTGGHRAGFDSFMTGFVFAAFLSRYGSFTHQMSNELKDLGMEDFLNKVYLSGKDIPLLIQKGNFSKTSKDHRDKLSKISV